ncbi:MAG TPA: diguanylate cyclase [Anaerolineales bacterium]|nr:diguanylate cyclase [Anaerolineales bacterium]
MSTKKEKKRDVTRPLKEPPAFEDTETADKDLSSLSNPLALLDAVAAISAPIDVRGIAEEVARQMVRFTDADVCAVSRWNHQDDTIALWVEYRRGESYASSIPYLPYKASKFPTTKNVLTSGVPRQLQLSDSHLDEGERTLMQGMDAKSLLLLPLVANEITVGLIELFETTHDRTFTPNEIANILVLAEHAGISLERAQLLSDEKRRAAQLEIIRQASLSLTASLEKAQVFDAILTNALRLSPDALDAHIFTYEDNQLVFGGSKWASGKEGPVWKEVRKGGLTDTVATIGETIAVEDVVHHPLYVDSQWVKDGWKGSIIGMPLKTASRVVGVLNIAYRTRQEFNKNRLRLLGLLADQAAAAITNVHLHELVKLQATTDTLTGLANRRAFDTRLEDEIKRSSRYHHTASLMMIDLDDFKMINDTFGHPTGDRVLQAVANCLQEAVRDTDFLARYGGDEFALILPETTHAQALTIDAKISEALSRCTMPWAEEGNPLKVTLSTGTASYPGDAKDAESLLAEADARLYIRKGEHR